MTPGAVENDTVELVVLKNPDMDPEIISLALLEFFYPLLLVISPLACAQCCIDIVEIVPMQPLAVRC